MSIPEKTYATAAEVAVREKERAAYLLGRRDEYAELCDRDVDERYPPLRVAPEPVTPTALDRTARVAAATPETTP